MQRWRLPGRQRFKDLAQRTGAFGSGDKVALVNRARMQAMILGAIHRNHLHMRLDRGDRRDKAVAIEAIGVQIIRRQVGGADHYHAFVEHHLEQAPENDASAYVVDEQFRRSTAPALRSPAPCHRTQRIGDASHWNER